MKMHHLLFSRMHYTVRLRTLSVLTWNYIASIATSFIAQVRSFKDIPCRLDEISVVIDEVRICLTNIDRNITELKDIDFIAVGR